MLEALSEWDRNLLVQMSMSGHHTPFLDFFMWMSTQIFIWLPAFLVLIYVVIKDKKREALLILGALVLLFLLCDQLTSSIIKPAVARLRPGKDPLVMNMLEYVNNYHGGIFGFPSSHAANSFGFALFSSLLLRYRWYTVTVFCWAALCAYTRIYLGVHFPLDIFSGLLTGMIVGWFCYWLYLKVRSKAPRYAVPSFCSDESVKITSSGFFVKNVWLLIYSLLIILFCIASCAVQFARFAR